VRHLHDFMSFVRFVRVEIFEMVEIQIMAEDS
jgi:hypothetical protein